MDTTDRMKPGMSGWGEHCAEAIPEHLARRTDEAPLDAQTVAVLRDWMARNWAAFGSTTLRWTMLTRALVDIAWLRLAAGDTTTAEDLDRLLATVTDTRRSTPEAMVRAELTGRWGPQGLRLYQQLLDSALTVTSAAATTAAALAPAEGQTDTGDGVT